MEIKLCPLFSGSSGNCIYVSAGDTHMLVDAGVSGTRISTALGQIGVNGHMISGLLITHEHSDHIAGAGILSRKYDIPIYATNKTWEAMHIKLGAIASKNIRTFEAGQDFFNGRICVQPFSIPHDAIDPVGYCFYSGNTKVSIATDLGHINNTWLDAVAQSDILLIESNHDIQMLKTGSYPMELKKRILGRNGHLSNDDAGKALIQLASRGVRHALLGHLSGENNIPQLAMDTVSSALINAGIAPCDLRLDMTYRDRISALYAVG